MTKNWKSLLAVMAAGALVMTGCAGTDGDTGADGAQGPGGPAGPVGPQGPDGPQGPQGPQGPGGQDGEDGQDAPVSLVEQCAACHDASLAAKHAGVNVVTVSNEAVTAAAATDTALNITFNVKVDGVNRNDFTHVAGAHKWTYQTAPKGGVRTTVATTDVTITQLFNGNYRATIANAGPVGASPAAPGTTFFVRVDTGNSAPQAAVVAHVGNAAQFAVVSNDACINCHGDYVFRGANHHSANAKGVEACVVCHNRFDTIESRLGTTATAPGTRLMGYVHGIHNSHNMADGVYSRNGSASASSQFSIGFPGYMTNCKTCHDTDASLAGVVAAPVSYSTCMSCHDGWDGFPGTVEGGSASFHRAFTNTQNCTTSLCHQAGGVGPATLGEFHNGLLTERSGLIWAGADQSVELGKTVTMSVDAVAIADAVAPATGKVLNITWSAKVNGAAFDACNADYAVGPVFFGKTVPAGTCVNTAGGCSSNMSVLTAYALANDWVNDGVGTIPGQPGAAPAITAANTTCTVGVAKTTVPYTPPANASKAVVSLQGKPQMKYAGTGNVIQIRSKSPTLEFVVADGSAPAVKRRVTVSIDKCNACHLGSVYQHGGNRVDSIELCVMCHNPASNEKNNRVGMGVDATEAYDGKAGETYDLRYMIHAIHSAGETGAPLSYYRSNGIYLWGNDETFAATPTWPAGAGAQQVFGATEGTTRTHNKHAVHYPRGLNECSACHVDGAVDQLPNPTMAVALTVDAGAAPWGAGGDDVLMGASAASCMSCHQSLDTVEQFIYRTHAYGFGFAPQAVEGGRQTILDAVTLP